MADSVMVTLLGTSNITNGKCNRILAVKKECRNEAGFI